MVVDAGPQCLESASPAMIIEPIQHPAGQPDHELEGVLRVAAEVHRLGTAGETWGAEPASVSTARTLAGCAMENGPGEPGEGVGSHAPQPAQW